MMRKLTADAYTRIDSIEYQNDYMMAVSNIAGLMINTLNKDILHRRVKLTKSDIKKYIDEETIAHAIHSCEYMTDDRYHMQIIRCSDGGLGAINRIGAAYSAETLSCDGQRGLYYLMAFNTLYEDVKAELTRLLNDQLG